jgi:hypothetical protein
MKETIYKWNEFASFETLILAYVERNRNDNPGYRLVVDMDYLPHA